MLDFVKTRTTATRVILGIGGAAFVVLLAITALSTIGLIAPAGLFLVLMAVFFICLGSLVPLAGSALS